MKFPTPIHWALIIVGAIFVILTFIAILLCIYTRRKSKRKLVRGVNYADPNDAIQSQRNSIYTTPYDNWRSSRGVMAVKSVSLKKSNPSKKKKVEYTNVDVTDGLIEVRPPANQLNHRQKIDNRTHEYLNVKFKDETIENKLLKPDVTKSSEGNHEPNDSETNGIKRKESERKNFPTPYSCIELDF